MSPSLKKTILIIAATCLLSCIFGISFNSYNVKHMRAPIETCKKNIIKSSIPDSSVCCADAAPDHDHLHICEATFHWSNRILASFYAWVIPLLPAAFTLLHDLTTGAASGFQLVTHHSKRLSFYLLIFLFRAYVLYLGLDLIQSSLQPPESSACWYLPLVGYKGCRDNFDFSDHIVLYMVQYALPCVIEMAYMLNSGHKRYWLSWVIALAVLAVAVRGIAITSMYFHTREESFVGLLVSILLAYLPVYHLPESFTAPFSSSSHA